MGQQIGGGFFGQVLSSSFAEVVHVLPDGVGDGGVAGLPACPVLVDRRAAVRVGVEVDVGALHLKFGAVFVGLVPNKVVASDELSV